MSRIKLTLLFVSLSILALAQDGKKRVDGIIAIVGDKEILLSDLEGQYLQFLQEGGNETEDLRCRILEDQLAGKLLLTKAEIDSIEVTDDEIEAQLDRRIQYFTQMMGGQVEKLEEFYGKSVLEIKEDLRDPIKEQALAQKMRSSITEGVKVTPKEVKDYFNKIPKDSLPYFESEIEVGQIVMFPELSKISRDYTINKLEELRRRVVEEGESFSTLAILYSEDPGSQKQGGDIGWFRRGEMVAAFEAVAFKLKPLEVSEVVETQFGYHILQLLERRGDRAHVRHILIRAPETEDDLLKTRKKLDSIRMDILNGEMDFVQSVKKYSQDEDSKNNAGLFRNPSTGDNYFTISELGKLPQNIYYNIKDLEAGDISSPAAYLSPEGKKGYRIFYLKSKTKPHRADINQDYNKIQNAALSAKKAKVVARWFEKYRSRTFIYLHQEYRSCGNLDAWTKATQP